MNITARLKKTLWQRFGAMETPAEWDGHVYGGGKLSQRFWEYLEAIDLLDLDEHSVVLDIGGGSPITGSGFFASLLATEIRKVIIIDPNIAPGATPLSNMVFLHQDANEVELTKVFQAMPEITHVSCISVFEHIESSLREGMMRALNAAFEGKSFVATFEYHARQTYFEHCLTARSTSSLFAPLTNFFPDQFRSSPVWCENAFHRTWLRRWIFRGFARKYTPLWYPVAIRFLRG